METPEIVKQCNEKLDEIKTMVNNTEKLAALVYANDVMEILIKRMEQYIK